MSVTLDEIGRDDTVDHGRDLVAARNFWVSAPVLFVSSGSTHGPPGAVIAELDPALVRSGLPLPDGRLVASNT